MEKAILFNIAILAEFANNKIFKKISYFSLKEIAF